MTFASDHASGRAALAYAGDVSPQQAWEVLSEHEDAMLIDVRTPPEWNYAGEPDLSALRKRPLLLSWKLYPHYALNGDFLADLLPNIAGKDTPLFFLCRVGGRSLDAACAVAAQGYTHCYNIEHGFDGPLDNQRHRGTVAGWKAQGLPWYQA